MHREQSNSNEQQEEEITSLFEKAKAKLDKIDAQATKDKKQIVKDLAKNLEERIQTDTISIEIVTQLHGRVSERFIHECLDEKYKQHGRVENARKQKKKRQEQGEGKENLAAVTPLNQEEAKMKKKVIIHDVHGRSIELGENPKPSPTSDNAVIDNSTVVTKAFSQPQGLKDESRQDLKECSSCKNLYFENLELKEALEKSTQLITANKLQSGEDATYHIPKVNHDLLIAAMKNSREFCSVVFDKNGILVHAEPDISREMTND